MHLHRYIGKRGAGRPSTKLTNDRAKAAGSQWAKADSYRGNWKSMGEEQYNRQ